MGFDSFSSSIFSSPEHCHWPMSVVRRASSVVRRQQFALNNISSKTARPRALIFGM